MANTMVGMVRIGQIGCRLGWSGVPVGADVKWKGFIPVGIRRGCLGKVAAEIGIRIGW